MEEVLEDWVDEQVVQKRAIVAVCCGAEEACIAVSTMVAASILQTHRSSKQGTRQKSAMPMVLVDL